MTTPHITIPAAQSPAAAPAFGGLLAGLRAASFQSWGALDVVGLFPAGDAPDRTRFVAPLEAIKLVQVPRYGTMVLRNTADSGLLVVPMHIGFFQEGAQNHATSRVLILEAGETLTADDCFCIQASQGGLLKEAQQRFLVLPLGLRRPALERRDTNDFSRLWATIDQHNRRYGIARGGHLERLLRPYFPRLQPLRHAVETLPGQVGAAYFVGGKLAGVEVAPNAAYWQDVAPILTMYCYGLAAVLAAQRGQESARQPLDLDGLADLDDLARRLDAARRHDDDQHVETLCQLADLPWSADPDPAGERHGLRVLTAAADDWRGQLVRDGADTVYLSAFRDVTAGAEDATPSAGGDDA
jgi:hypothetical protein